MSLPPLTTRRMMILVALLALMLGGAIEFSTQKRAAEYRRLGLIALGQAQQALMVSDELEQEAVTTGPQRAVQCRSMATTNRKWTSYECALARWYLEAASRPWPQLSSDAPMEPK